MSDDKKTYTFNELKRYLSNEMANKDNIEFFATFVEDNVRDNRKYLVIKVTKEDLVSNQIDMILKGINKISNRLDRIELTTGQRCTICDNNIAIPLCNGCRMNPLIENNDVLKEQEENPIVQEVNKMYPIDHYNAPIFSGDASEIKPENEENKMKGDIYFLDFGATKEPDPKSSHVTTVPKPILKVYILTREVGESGVESYYYSKVAGLKLADRNLMTDKLKNLFQQVLHPPVFYGYAIDSKSAETYARTAIERDERLKDFHFEFKYRKSKKK